MTKDLIRIGAAANDNTGDTLRAGAERVNNNFNEIYTALGSGSVLNVNTANAANGQVLRYNGTNFVAANYNELTSALDVNGNNIISSSNGNISLDPHGTGSIILTYGSSTATFSGSDGSADFSGTIQYSNEYDSLSDAPAASVEQGYFYTVDGDDNPYVNMNITAGGAGDVRAKILTEYSSIDSLSDVDITTNAPTNNQVLKWNSTDSKFVPADDSAGVASVNVFATVTGDSGTTTANSQTDTLTIAGGTNITTSVSGDTVTVDFSGSLTTTLAALTDTDLTGTVQGNSLFYDGSDWVDVASPIIWWDLGANGSSDFTFSGPGFPSTANDPTLYVYRGFTYAFDNTANGASHPLRIQETQGLSGIAYTDGQSGSSTAVLYWTVPMDAPNTLYYQCTSHAAMQGTINVVS